MADAKLQQWNAFPTPILEFDWTGVDNLNKSLHDDILEYEKKHVGIKRSNSRLTYHTDGNIFKHPKESMSDLRKMFHHAYAKMAELHGADLRGRLHLAVSGWAMVSRGEGDYACPHTHPNCHFSGVYYVNGLEGVHTKFPESGQIEFMDIRGGPGGQMVPGLVLNPRMMRKPAPGKMLIFPSWLPHFVHPFFGDGTRIAVATNCSIRNYEPPKKEA